MNRSKTMRVGETVYLVRERNGKGDMRWDIYRSAELVGRAFSLSGAKVIILRDCEARHQWVLPQDLVWEPGWQDSGRTKMAAGAAHPDRVYMGCRLLSGCEVWFAWPGGIGRLHPDYSRVNHSPDGFEWGYCGSGPAQLAFTLVAHATGDLDRAEAVYQDFKRAVVASWGATWTMTRAELLRRLARVEAKRLS